MTFHPQSDIRFAKMNGAGNDFIIIDTDTYPINNPHSAAIDWCDRKSGIGADGVVLLSRADTNIADFSMRIINSDGSEAMMCGNACRCIGKYLYDNRLTSSTEIRLLTPSGIRILKLSVDSSRQVRTVRVDMGIPAFENLAFFIPDGPPLPKGTFVDMGNPLYVIFTDEETEMSEQIEKLGRQLEIHPRFPQRCNIVFATLHGGGILIRVWERGCGETKACGTGACAAVAAACKNEPGDRKKKIVMDGGAVEVTWDSLTDHIWLEGDAEFEFDGTITTGQ